MARRSVFRFVSSPRRSDYSVWRGDQHLGYVEKQTHRIIERGRTKTIVTGWMAHGVGPVALPGRHSLTREDAAKRLWERWQDALRKVHG